MPTLQNEETEEAGRRERERGHRCRKQKRPLGGRPAPKSATKETVFGGLVWRTGA